MRLQKALSASFAIAMLVGSQRDVVTAEWDHQGHRPRTARRRLRYRGPAASRSDRTRAGRNDCD